MKRLQLSILLSTVVVLGGCCQEQARLTLLEEPATGSWGDQGDGTFINPILNSNYPDTDVEKEGDTWYMISSKGKYMKGMTVLKSKDLVNWEIAGGMVERLPWESPYGVWAGDLAKHDDIWHCYFTDFGKGLYRCFTKDIEGQWSEPELILEKKGMTDPAVFWDEEAHQAYLICNYDIKGAGNIKIHHIRLFKLSWDGTKLEDEGTEIYAYRGAEAAKIYKIGDKFYIFLSEWTSKLDGSKDDRRQIVLRSDNIYGPYEKKVLLERGNGTNRSCCQGSLLQAPDSSWWYMHQLVQSKNTYEGRPQFLIPVTWKEEWPLLGEDTDGNGIGNTVWHCHKPVQGHPVRMVATDDDFNAPELAGQWLWHNNPIDEKWSLSEKRGHLRLYSTNPDDPDHIWQSLPNKLLQRKMGKGTDTVTVKMSSNGFAENQLSGLICSGYNYVSLGLMFKKGEYSVYSDINGKRTVVPVAKKKYLYFRTCLQQRSGHCEYSLDCKEYHRIGPDFIMETRGFDGIFFGLFSMNPSGKGYADFDWFHYSYDGPKSTELIFH